RSAASIRSATARVRIAAPIAAARSWTSRKPSRHGGAGHLPLSGAGVATCRHGARPRRELRRRAPHVRGGRRRARNAALAPLLRGARASAGAHGTRSAGHSRGQRRRPPGARGDECSRAGRGLWPQPRRVVRARRGGRARLRRCGARGARAWTAHAGSGAGGRGDDGRGRGARRRRRDGALRRRRGRRRARAREPEWRGAGRGGGPRPRGRSPRRARQRQAGAGAAAARERAISLLPHGSRRGRARAGAPRVSGELDGQVAVVTGASRGIGRATALALASAGAEVVVNYLTNEAAAEETVRSIAARGGVARAARFDVGDGEAVRHAMQNIVDHGGRIDILVNNAGLAMDALLLRLKAEDWERALRVNLTGVFHCTRGALRAMVRAHYGRIVN